MSKSTRTILCSKHNISTIHQKKIGQCPRVQAFSHVWCRATNAIPHNGYYQESKAYILDIKYSPICDQKGVKLYKVAKEEKVTISCKVAANPSNLIFSWALVNFAEAKEKIKLISNSSIGLLSYQPKDRLDYGTLICKARNIIGEQRKPCLFHIIYPGFEKNRTVEVLDNINFQGNRTDRHLSVTTLRVYLIPLICIGSAFAFIVMLVTVVVMAACYFKRTYKTPDNKRKLLVGFSW